MVKEKNTTIDDPTFDENGTRTQVITSNKSGSTVTINDVENAVFHGVSKPKRLLFYLVLI